MERDFWVARWREGRIGFHEGRPNAQLTRHVGQLGAGRRVLVPLCGKADDLAYLAAQGHDVVGIELVEDAVRAFFAERRLTPSLGRRGSFTVFAHGRVTLLAGDVFDATREDVGPVDALYDRAALIALPESMRGRYVAQLRRLIPPGARGLVVTLEYPPGAIEGPPFSVSEAELRQLYAGALVEHLSDVPADGPRLSPFGAAARERCFGVRW
jgi:thiopurine S-methyltransferase